MTKLIIEDGVLLEFRGRDKHVEIPKGVVEIEREAFANHRGLQSVTIPAGVLEIGEDAFSGCKNLERVTLPEGLEIIGAGAFCGCYALRSIRLPRSVKEIGFSAFRHCESLESIVTPAGVSSLMNIFRLAIASRAGAALRQRCSLSSEVESVLARVSERRWLRKRFVDGKASA